MQKTNLGISVGLFGAAIYLTALASGYLVPVVLAGYVLLFESNEWLRYNAVKAIAVLLTFSLTGAVIFLIPDALDVLGDVAAMFGGHFSIGFIDYLAQALSDLLGIAKTLLLLGLGMKALNQGSISVGFIDSLLSRYMA